MNFFLNSNYPSLIESELPVENRIQNVNGKYIMDLSSSVSSKRLQRNENFAAGYISEANSSKILDGQELGVRPILRSGGKAANGNPIIDLNEAIRKDMVFLPDSLVETQQVKYVIDLKTGERVGFDEACKSGICF